MVTLDEKLKAEGYRNVATLDRSELFTRGIREIPRIEEMDYFVVPVDFALAEEPIGPAYAGLHYIYVKERSLQEIYRIPKP